MTTNVNTERTNEPLTFQVKGTGELPDRNLNNWLEDNDIDPGEVAADAPIRIREGSIIVTEFIYEERADGTIRRKLYRNEAGLLCSSVQEMTCPREVNPLDYGLEVVAL